jgi:uroporphyrinogen-III synthase
MTAMTKSTMIKSTMIKSRLNFVVTRPLNQANTLIQMLKQHSDGDKNCSVVHLPLIQIKELQIQTVKASKLETKNYNGVVFISPNAVTTAYNQLSMKEWANLIQVPLFTVGSSTAETLKNFSNATVIKIPQQMNTEGLLELPELCHVSEESWLIIKGVGGREKLKNTLVKRGANVTELCTYKRLKPSDEMTKNIALHLKNDAIWIITSVQAIKNLDTVVKKLDFNPDCRIIVSSDRIKQSAINLGLNVIAVANDATDKQLINCIRELKL